jgi:hypothetical protein
MFLFGGINIPFLLLYFSKFLWMYLFIYLVHFLGGWGVCACFLFGTLLLGLGRRRRRRRRALVFLNL